MSGILMYIIYLLPFFKPKYITQIPNLNKIYNVAQVLIAIIIFLKFLKRKKLSRNFLPIIVMEAILIFSSLINGLAMSEVIINVIQTLALCMLVEVLGSEDIKKLFLALTIVFNFLIFIDFTFVCLYPMGIRSGLYNIWFFGAKNGHIAYIIPAIFCNYVNNFLLRDKKTNILKLQFIFLILESVYILFVVKSTTSIIAMAILLILIMISNNKVYSKISMKIISLIYLIVVIGIVGFQIQNNFADIIENVFNKDITFTGRTEIWSKTIDLIKERPILGYGLESSEYRTVKLNNIAALNAHNMLLEVIYTGGVILLIVFIAYWIKVCEKIDSYSKRNGNILKSILIVYCVELLTEAFAFEVFLWILVLVYKVSYLKVEGVESVTKQEEH